MMFFEKKRNFIYKKNYYVNIWLWVVFSCVALVQPSYSEDPDNGHLTAQQTELPAERQTEQQETLSDQPATPNDRVKAPLACKKQRRNMFLNMVSKGIKAALSVLTHGARLGIGTTHAVSRVGAFLGTSLLKSEIDIICFFSAFWSRAHLKIINDDVSQQWYLKAEKTIKKLANKSALYVLKKSHDMWSWADRLGYVDSDGNSPYQKYIEKCKRNIETLVNQKRAVSIGGQMDLK